MMKTKNLLLLKAIVFLMLISFVFGGDKQLNNSREGTFTQPAIHSFPGLINQPLLKEAKPSFQKLDSQPKILVTLMDPKSRGKAVFIIGHQLVGRQAVKEFRFRGIPGVTTHGPVRASYPKVGAVQIYRVKLPEGIYRANAVAITKSGKFTKPKPILIQKDLVESPAGSGVPRVPTIFLVLPNAGPNFCPISITGTNFSNNSTVWFGSVPAMTIVSFSTKTLPLIGSVSEIVTLVPPNAVSCQLCVENLGGARSNGFPFTVQ